MRRPPTLPPKWNSKYTCGYAVEDTAPYQGRTTTFDVVLPLTSLSLRSIDLQSTRTMRAAIAGNANLVRRDPTAMAECSV